MSNRQLSKHGIRPDNVTEIKKAFSAGDVSTVIDLTTMDLVEKLSISGSPEECIDKIEDLKENGLNHLLLLITSDELIQHVASRKITGMPSFAKVLKLVHTEIMPHFQ